MEVQDYPIFVRYPDAHVLAPSEANLLADELQRLAWIEQEFIRAQQVISQIDISALALAYQTIQTAELLKNSYGWSVELEEFDRIRRQYYLDTMNELISQAHAQVLGYLRGE